VGEQRRRRSRLVAHRRPVQCGEPNVEPARQRVDVGAGLHQRADRADRAVDRGVDQGLLQELAV
jgi:hypothetical protein